MPTYNFTFYRDAGHGWLEVPYDLLIALRIESTISQLEPYSYERTIVGVRYAYLEQIFDAGQFLTRMEELEFHFTCTYKYEERSNIRDYTPFGKNNITSQPHRG